MTLGIATQTQPQALAQLSGNISGAQAIGKPEYLARIANAQAKMKAEKIDAIWVHAGTNLAYFTGTHWHPSERMVGALIPDEGPMKYIAPYFEQNTLRDFWVVEGEVKTWHEHESPYALFARQLSERAANGRIGLSEDTPFFAADGLQNAAPTTAFVNAKTVTAHCRMRKSANEIALMQRAKSLTLEVHKAAASVLREGITTTEVEDFIDRAHRKVSGGGSTFCIVLFGPASAFPHGVKNPQVLKPGDMVLIDTGCKVHDYPSDITRSYVFGPISEAHRRVWNAEKAAQAAAFAAAQLGTPCGEVDRAARRSLEANGFGPAYQLPGLPHRTGHGIGLDIHEWPYLVGSDATPLDVGMCFSNEPMICVPGEFGVRLEDHFYMSEAGPTWFTEPSHSIDDPFGLGRQRVA
ncbi:MAG: aminopeptidase P family protein [Betaproteobacteria bacterium]|nr:aminopeptidase P family protein [Betaproteobacteria bacterium]